MGILAYFERLYVKKTESYLPTKLSFLEIDNNGIMLSALKKSEKDNSLTVRCYNITSKSQTAKLTFYNEILIERAEKVNFLEETPRNEIKAAINSFKDNYLNISVEPHVIATLKIKVQFNDK